ncbi:MAG TPA: DUF3365 domain-containing protein [Flavobacteriaceae bacterium]|nr:DUF3365 domain-containing protein [Flavobacteriaceae bacterium]
MIRIGLVVLILLCSISCQDSKYQSLPEEKRAFLINVGDSISSELQGILLKNVADAIKQGGTTYAVDFCNLNAYPLTEEVSKKHKVKIERLTDKPRNTKNAITAEIDQEAWERIKSGETAFLEQNQEGELYFYKPILIGMPTCLQCHGKTKDIQVSTLELIENKYPEDKALEYEIGDLRGMWKIKFEHPSFTR